VVARNVADVQLWICAEGKVAKYMGDVQSYKVRPQRVASDLKLIGRVSSSTRSGQRRGRSLWTEAQRSGIKKIVGSCILMRRYLLSLCSSSVFCAQMLSARTATVLDQALSAQRLGSRKQSFPLPVSPANHVPRHLLAVQLRCRTAGARGRRCGRVCRWRIGARRPVRRWRRDISLRPAFHERGHVRTMHQHNSQTDPESSVFYTHCKK